jgi:hypothetical protein
MASMAEIVSAAASPSRRRAREDDLAWVRDALIRARQKGTPRMHE